MLAGHIESPGLTLSFLFPDANHRDICWLAKDLGHLAERCLPAPPIPRTTQAPMFDPEPGRTGDGP